MLDIQEEKIIANIEQELKRLWDEQKDKKQIKACLFNLIIYTQESRRTAYFHKTVRSIIQKFPSRILFIEAKKDGPENYMHVTVSTQTTGVEGSLVACDQIAITSSFQNLPRIPYIVIPHLVPDLPVYLIWGQDPTEESQLLPAFQKIANRLIFDSECIKNLQVFSEQMRAKMKTEQIDFIDMHWALLGCWRKVLATVFDTPERSLNLRFAKRIEILYNNRKTEFFHHYETQSLYLQAWLAAQMDWPIASMSYENEGRKISYANGLEVYLLPKTHEIHPSGAILEVAIDCPNQIQYSISREKHWSKAICHICYPDRCEAPSSFLMPDLEKGINFMREIFFSKPGDHYRNMLKVLSQISWEKK